MLPLALLRSQQQTEPYPLLETQPRSAPQTGFSLVRLEHGAGSSARRPIGTSAVLALHCVIRTRSTSSGTVPTSWAVQ